MRRAEASVDRRKLLTDNAKEDPGFHLCQLGQGQVPTA